MVRVAERTPCDKRHRQRRPRNQWIFVTSGASSNVISGRIVHGAVRSSTLPLPGLPLFKILTLVARRRDLKRTLTFSWPFTGKVYLAFVIHMKIRINIISCAAQAHAHPSGDRKAASGCRYRSRQSPSQPRLHLVRRRHNSVFAPFSTRHHHWQYARRPPQPSVQRQLAEKDIVLRVCKRKLFRSVKNDTAIGKS